MAERERALTSCSLQKAVFLLFSLLPLLSLVVSIFLWPMRPFESVSVEEFVELELPEEVAPTKSFKAQVTSLIFWLCAIFTTFNLLRVNYYIATVGEQLLAFPGYMIFPGNQTVSQNELQVRGCVGCLSFV